MIDVTSDFFTPAPKPYRIDNFGFPPLWRKRFESKHGRKPTQAENIRAALEYEFFEGPIKVNEAGGYHYCEGRGKFLAEKKK